MKLLKVTALSVVIAVGVSCSTKKTEKAVHEPKIDTSPRPLDADTSIEQQGLLSEALTKYNQILNRKELSMDELMAAIQTLSQEVLNEDVILDPEKSRSIVKETANKLQVFNQLLLRSIKQDPADKRLLEILTNPEDVEGVVDYESLLLEGIERNKKVYLTYFKQSHLSAEILGRIIEMRWNKYDTTAKDYHTKIVRDYRDLQYALYEIGNSQESLYLFGLYFSKSLDYAEALSAASKNEELQAHIGKLFNILDKIDSTISSDCPQDQASGEVSCISLDAKNLYLQVKSFVENSHFWDPPKEANPFIEAIRDRTMNIALHFLYDESGHLNKGYRKYLIESQNKEDSFLQKLLKIKKDFGKNALAEIGFDPDKYLKNDTELKEEYYNIYFDIISKLFNSTISLDGATQVWIRSSIGGPKENILLDSLDGYIKVELLDQMRETRSRLGRFYDDNNLVMGAKKDFIDSVYREARGLSRDWKALFNNITRVLVLTQKFFKRPQVTLQNPKFTQIENMVDSIKKNVVLLSVYPNQMMMAYLITKNSTKLELGQMETADIKDMFGKAMMLKLSDDDGIVNSLFDGGIITPRPWFDFGIGSTDDDKAQASKWEILNSYIYAASSKVFNTPSINSNQIFTSSVARDLISFADFFITVLIETERKKYDATLDYISNRMLSDKYEKFLAVCRKLDNTQDIWTQGNLKVLGGEPIDLTLLSYSVLIGQESQSAAFGSLTNTVPMRAAMDMIPSSSKFITGSFDSDFGFAIARINKKSRNQLVFLNSWLQYMKTYYNNAYSAEEVKVINEQIAKIESKVAVYQRQIKAVLTRAKLAYEEVGTCTDTILAYEQEVKKQIIKSEIDDLSKVHDSLGSGDMNAPLAYKSVLEELKSNPTTNRINFEQEFNVDMSSKTFLYSRLGALLKVRKHLQDITGATVLIPNGLENMDIYKDARGLASKLTYSENNKFEFVKQGIVFSFGENSNVTDWKTNSEFHRNYLYTSINLFRLGPVDYLGGPECNKAIILSSRILNDYRCIEQNGYLVSADRLIDETIKFAKIYNVSEKDYQEIYRYTGRQSVRDQITHFTNFFMDQNTKSPLTLLEGTYEELVDPINTVVEMTSSTNGLTTVSEVMSFYKDMSKATTLIFEKTGKPYMKILKHNYKNHLLTALQPILDFEEAVGRRAFKDKDLDPITVVYQRDPLNPDQQKMITTEVRDDKAIYLSESFITNQERMRTKIFSTVGQFFNEALDSSDQLTLESLASRYEIGYQKAKQGE